MTETKRERGKSRIEMENIKRGEYEVFNPYPRGLDQETKQELVKESIRKTAQQKVFSRVPRLTAFLIIPAMFFPLLAFGDIQLSSMMGYALLLFLFFFYINFFLLFRTGLSSLSDPNSSTPKSNTNVQNLTTTVSMDAADAADNDTTGQSNNLAVLNKNGDDFSYLFRIYSLHGKIDNWSNMSICYSALLFKQFPIRSMSEYCSIKGGSANLMLLTVSQITWVLLIVMTALDMAGLRILFGFGIAAQYIGTFGFVLMGTFESDPFNAKMYKTHYLGSLLMIFMHIAYMQQQFVLVIKSDNYFQWQWHILPSLVLFGVCIGSGLLWKYKFSPKCDAYIENRRNMSFVNRNMNVQDINMAEIMGDMGDKAKSGIGNGNGDGTGVSEPSLADIINASMTLEAKKEVTRMSFNNIMAETVYQISCLLAMCLWFINNEFCHTEFVKKGCTVFYS